MEWKTLIESRTTQFAFADRAVDFEHIHAVVAHTVSHVPSKQLHQPYTVHIVDNTPKLKLKFAEWTHRDPDYSVADDPGNPQSQAPCILMFVPNSDTVSDLNRHSSWLEIWLEIGIVSASCNYALIDAGYACGYCRCFAEPNAADLTGNDLMAQHFNLDHTPVLIMGVGYASDSHSWWDPRTQNYKPLPVNSTTGKGLGTREPKPVSDIVRSHY